MIRLATLTELSAPPQDETGIRIQSLYRAYGMEVPFIRYYSDGEGGLLAIMDGTGLLSVPGNPGDEWTTFLNMNPDVVRVHCAARTGRRLSVGGGWTCETGQVLRYAGAACADEDTVSHQPSLPAVYALLEETFPGISPLDAWYPDASHRMRHGCAHIACVIEGETVVSTAMTVAETAEAAIIGQVATASTHRRMGLASRCIRSLISVCKVNQLYILPLNESAERLYISLGFIPDGGWAELKRV